MYSVDTSLVAALCHFSDWFYVFCWCLPLEIQLEPRPKSSEEELGWQVGFELTA